MRPIQRVRVLLLAVAAALPGPKAAAQVDPGTPGVTPPGLGAVGPGTVAGKPEVVDGDTLRIGGRLVRLAGIDAPEADQTCDRDGRPWACGTAATFGLAYAVATHWVTCTPQGENGEAVVATCFVGPYDLAERVVRAGWALAIPGEAGRVYAPAEVAARDARVGLWQGTFAAPWDWRAGLR